MNDKNKNILKKNKNNKLGLISQTRNPLNLGPKLNQETQYPTNLMLRDEIKKNY